jgi:hypothetical protein
MINLRKFVSSMGNKTGKFIVWHAGLIFLAAAVLIPHILHALTLTSPNYKLENPSFTSGGGNRNSATYRSQDATGSGAPNSNSANYKVQPGAIPPIFPGIPGIPTLTNTGSNLYSNLDFVINAGSNAASDVTFAIAISTDNFTTTNFIQSDDTVGATEAWQTYANWGSATGERLIQLTVNTTYKIKVKARLGANNESGYSNVATAATVNPTLTMTVAGLSTGAVVSSSVGTTTTNITATETTVPFGNLSVGSIKVGAQTVTVTTNAVSGYTTAVFQDHDLVKTNGVTIPALVATNSSPAVWPAGITAARFGYHTTDFSLCAGTAGRFSNADTYSALDVNPFEVACSNGPVASEATTVVFKVEIEGLQPPGNYQNKISYITSAQY